ncbi:MAG: type I glyceraldehyde-3-phosphate dehydrogenase [Cellvibrionales bacterium]|nr:type I glyceraldehyde-3-phosphate dehydrogenase [Cellvibrionales bacterium]
MLRIAINGFGRIGRNILRACYENSYRDRLEVVAINDLGSPQVNTHLLQFDSTHGPFPGTAEAADGKLVVEGDAIAVLAEKDPAALPWKDLGVDLVMECTGLFTTRESAGLHLQAGAGRVLVSAPGKEMDATVVHGVNHQTLRAGDRLISNASCTTNCLAPVALALHRAMGIERGLATTVHAYTNDQVLTDVYHSDLRRARSATQSMIPTKTGAAAAIGEVLPELKGKLDGLAVRVPVLNVSLLDLTVQTGRETTVEEVNRAVTDTAATMPAVLAINELPLVSVDFNHHSASCIFDSAQTRVLGNQVKVLAWYDNEWGFANRMLDNAVVIAGL